MAHIVLLGASIFDNASYVPAGMHVHARLEAVLGTQDRVSPPAPCRCTCPHRSIAITILITINIISLVKPSSRCYSSLSNHYLDK
jgi:hypothetical protein